MSEKNALDVAAADILAQEEQPSNDAAELFKMIGRHEAFGLMAGKTTTAWAECLKRIRDSKAYKQFGMTWDDFCPKQLSISRQTADRIIGDLEEFGATYFALSQVTRISRERYRLIAGQVTDDGKLDLGGELVPITKSNADRIREFLEETSSAMRREKEEHSRTRGALTKAKEQAENSKKAAEAARKKLLDRDNEAALRWKNADADHAFLLDLQQKFDLMAVQIRSFVQRELTPENQDRFVAFCDYVFSVMHQTTEHAKAEYGVGFCSAAPPSAFDEVDALTPAKRDLVCEYNQAHLKR